MATRYVPIHAAELRSFLEPMGFVETDDRDSWEQVWTRDVVTKRGQEFPYKIKVYTTVDKRTHMSRDSGEDAIRLFLIDKVTDRKVSGSPSLRVFRTKNALPNLRERARELFEFVLQGPHCPVCGALMVRREGGPSKRPFWGCSHYAPKNPWHCRGTREITE